MASTTTTTLLTRIASLETELRLTQCQLAQSQTATSYIITTLAGQQHQPQLTAQNQAQLAAQKSQDQDAEIETLRAQLEDALRCNECLERLLATSRRAKAIIQNRMERMAHGRLRALERAGGDDVFEMEERMVARKEESVVEEEGMVVKKEESMVDEFDEVVDEEIDNGDLLGWSPSVKIVRDGWTLMEQAAMKSTLTEEVAINATNDNRSSIKAQDPATGVDTQIESSDEAGLVRTKGSAVEGSHNECLDETGFTAIIKAAANRECADETIITSKAPEIEIETGDARPIHLDPYHMTGGKQYSIQPQASPQRSQWSGPPPSTHGPNPHSETRWPNPRARPYTSTYNRPYMSRNPSLPIFNSFCSPDPTLRRTVLVTNLPIGLTAAGLLKNHLSSDRVLEAKFAGTAGMKTIPPIEKNAAILEFFDNEDAENFVGMYARHEAFGVMLVPTATRPLRRARVDSMFN
jgi:hypothetical protein